MIEGRKAALLEAVVSEHIRTAEPVGSKFLVGKYGLKVSPATLRNDMSALEKEGYLVQPHTSAGRVPTVKAYRYYVQHCVGEKSPTKKNRTVMEEQCAKAEPDDRRVVKELAKTVADLAHEAILVGFASDEVYYTGLSYLFAQPEFLDPELAVSMANGLDRLSDVMQTLLANATDDLTVAIGDENPFGEDTSVIFVRYGKDAGNIFGILGPTRMHYAENIALAKYVREVIKKHFYG